MRVLHFFKAYKPDSTGGIEQVIYQICQSSLSHGIHSEVLTLSPNPSPPELMVDDHLVHRARLDLRIASTGISLSVIKRFRHLAALADVVHYHFPWPFMDLVHLIAGARKPMVVSYHSDIVRQKRLLHLYRPLMHHFLKQADRIVVASPNYMATSEVLQRYRNKSVVIPYGLDQRSYPMQSVERVEQWRRRCGERFFLFIGVMRYYKGLHVLLEAARCRDYPVIIMGAGPLETELKAQARRLGLSNVQFLGSLDDDDKIALLELCSAVVFPSHLRSEAFGVSLLEGAMFGKAMISSEIGTGTSFINVHGETGLVVPPCDPEALRAAMDQLWSNPEQCALLGRRARARYESLFTAEGMGGRMARLYQDVVDAHG